MAKSINHKNKTTSCSKLWLLAAASLLIFVPYSIPWQSFLKCKSKSEPEPDAVNPRSRTRTTRESSEPTFYDDPETSYTVLGKPMTEWDEKRSHWLKLHPSFLPSDNRVLVVTGSQPSPCPSPVGDHLLLRFFKNKVDYCRIHGYDIFYNNAFLHEKPLWHWSKVTALRAAMVAHPEAEWLFWVDSDALFSDMDFEVPFERYEGYNMVVHGSPDRLYRKRSWLSVNSGVFLLRNCRWSMEFLDIWAEMGPMGPNYERWGQILKETLTQKVTADSSDQSALVYLLLEGEKRWTEKIYVENEYELHGYWLEIVGRFDELRAKEKGLMRRRHAEAERGRRAEEGGWRRPFVTHFVGCQPCSGYGNPAFEGDTCKVGMERALNFADDQVLRNYGFERPDLGNSTLLVVNPCQFD